MTKNQKIVKAFLAGMSIREIFNSRVLNPTFRRGTPVSLCEDEIEHIIRKAMIRRGKKRAR